MSKYVLVLTSLISTLFANAISPYSRIVVIGDSLSDVGRSYQLTHGQLPKEDSYYMGRFSDGPVWVEQLAWYYKAELENYAVGGARTNNTDEYPSAVDPDDPTYIPPSAVDQLKTLQDSSASHPPDWDKTLVLMNIGSNDGLLSHFQADPIHSVLVIRAIVDELKALGVKHLAIADLVDIDEVPLQKDNPTDVIRAWVDMFNTHLDTLTRHYNIPVIPFRKTLQAIHKSPEDYGFRPDFLDKYCFHGVGRVCPQRHRRSYVYWDGLHPTKATHHFFAEGAKTVLLAPKQPNFYSQVGQLS